MREKIMLFVLVITAFCLQGQKNDFKVFKITADHSIFDVGFGSSSTCNDFMYLVVNGPLYGLDNQPVGGFIQPSFDKRGNLIGSQVKDWVNPTGIGGNFEPDNGIFGVTTTGRAILERYEDFIESPQSLIWGFQNGRILLKDSQILSTYNQGSTNKYYRSGIGFDADNKVHIVISLKKVTYYQLASKFIELGCTNAIYLDGYEETIGWSTRYNKKGLEQSGMKLQFFCSSY